MPPRPDAPSPRRPVLELLLIAGAVLAVYLVWIRSGFNYDDRVEFIRVAAPETARDVAALFGEPSYPTLPYYRPITKASLLVQKSIWGLDPVPFHVANALLGVAAGWCALALFLVPALGIPRPLALAGALLFALHPIASSCVYPPSGGRYSLLSAVFMLGALAAYLRPGRSYHMLAMASFALALLSKEQAVIVLPLFVLADVLGLTKAAPGRSPARWLRRYAAPGALLVAYGLARMAVFRDARFELSFFEKPTVIALTPVYALQAAFAPSWELIYEPMRVATWFSVPRLSITFAAVIGVAWLIRRQPAPRTKLMAFWAAWFILGLLPSANLVSQDVAYDERYTFMSLAAVIGVTAFAAGSLWLDPLRRPILRALAAAAVFAAAATTLQRGRFFENDLAFTEQWVRTSPLEYLPHYSHGVALAENGRADEAVAAYERALALNPAWPDTHMNLGALQLQRNNPRLALRHFENYARLQPRSAKAHYSVGVARLMSGEFARASDDFKHALAIQPRYAEAHHNLAVAFQHLDRIADAIAHYEATLVIEPGTKSTRENLAALRAERVSGPETAAR